MKGLVAPSLALVALIAACAPLPKPFRGASPPPLATPTDPVEVRIEPVAGAAEPLSRLLAESLARALTKENVQATVGGGTQTRFVVTGRAEPNRDDPSLPYIMLIHWTLLDGDRAPIGFQTQGILGPRWQWDYGDPRLLSRVGGEGSRIVAALLRDAEADDDAATATPDVHVVGAQGAPGDGNRALAAALGKALRAAGLIVSNDTRTAPYRVAGTIVVDPPSQGRQRVSIVWEVRDPAGNSVGRASQANQVAAGSLEGAWGPIASAVARAAVPGIGEVIARHRFQNRGSVSPPPLPRP